MALGAAVTLPDEAVPVEVLYYRDRVGHLAARVRWGRTSEMEVRSPETHGVLEIVSNFVAAACGD